MMNRFTVNTVLFLVAIFSLISCSKKKIDMNNLDETIMVRHKNADMPAYIHGNASEKVFLIILHGGPGGSGLTYRSNTIKSEIESNNAVVYFDQRGSGNSQGNYSEDEVSVDIMAEDVLALVKSLQAKYGEDAQFFLMGHSWGGTLGPAVLLKDQSSFSGWIDVDGSHDPKAGYNAYKIALKGNADDQIALGNNIEYWESVIELTETIDVNYSLDNYFRLNRETHIAENKLVADDIINPSVLDGLTGLEYNKLIDLWNSSRILDILANKRGLYEHVSYTDRLHEITIPSMVLWGKYDIIVPAAFAQEAFDNLGGTNKEIYIFGRSGHSPMFSEPDLFADRVIDFINQNKE